MHTCAPYNTMPMGRRGWLDPLKLELGVALSVQVGAEVWTRFSARAASAVGHWAISPASCYLFLNGKRKFTVMTMLLGWRPFPGTEDSCIPTQMPASLTRRNHQRLSSQPGSGATSALGDKVQPSDLSNLNMLRSHLPVPTSKTEKEDLIGPRSSQVRQSQAPPRRGQSSPVTTWFTLAFSHQVTKPGIALSSVPSLPTGHNSWAFI